MTQDFDKIFDGDKPIPDEFLDQVSQRVFEMMHERRNRMDFKCQTFRVGAKETDDEIMRLFNEGWRLDIIEKFNDFALIVFTRKADSSPIYQQ